MYIISYPYSNNFQYKIALYNFYSSHFYICFRAVGEVYLIMRYAGASVSLQS